jgi:hypothetical protein
VSGTANKAVDVGYPLDILTPVSKLLFSIPEELLAEIDREASARGDSRSGFIQEAARRELSRPSRARIEAALARGRRALQDVGAFEAADVIRDDRDARDTADSGR